MAVHHVQLYSRLNSDHHSDHLIDSYSSTLHADSSGVTHHCSTLSRTDMIICMHPLIAGTAAADDSDGEELSAEKEAELERKATKRAETRQAAAREMPYVMPCPQSMEELLELLAKHAASAADANTVVSYTCFQ
jgi:Nop14-like family